MNWKKWLKYPPYKKLWSIIFGRPWTFISRDIWHQAEIVPIMVLLFSGWFAGRFWDEILYYMWLHPLQALGILTAYALLWYTAGHILWGKLYKPGQKGSPL